MKIAIAGASGFVGRSLIAQLQDKHQIIALGRSVSAADSTHRSAEEGTASRVGVEWRACDLFSLLQTEVALEGADIAIYLVHSMLPTARLMQSTFENADLLLADNFARAAKKAKIKRIIYLGGLIPTGGKLSRHLMSRLEVESALSSQGASVTTLRAGMILGARGSSFQMLYLLVKRLPILVCPRWTAHFTQCIDIRDVVDLINFCLERPDTSGQIYDIGCPNVMTYLELMRTMARVMGVKRFFCYIPLLSPGLSRWWVQMITGASNNLVSPLIQSLRHEMVVNNSRLLELYGKPLRKLETSLRECLVRIEPTLRQTTTQRKNLLRRVNTVKSIQRLPLPPGTNAIWLGAEYFRWLPHFLSPFIQVDHPDPRGWNFRLFGLRATFLRLEYSDVRSTPDRQLFYIRGGLLTRKDQSAIARLEFREALGGQCSLAAIHDFSPSLPWVIYKGTQAFVHLWVMNRFRKHLKNTHQCRIGTD